jgi:Fe-S cluster biosynthesis and repair protein YggX
MLIETQRLNLLGAGTRKVTANAEKSFLILEKRQTSDLTAVHCAPSAQVLDTFGR